MLLLGFGAVLPILAVLASSAGVAATAVTGLNAAMLLNPVGLVIAGVVALGVALYELYRTLGRGFCGSRRRLHRDQEFRVVDVRGRRAPDGRAHAGHCQCGYGARARGGSGCAPHPGRLAVQSSEGWAPAKRWRHVRISETIAETIRPGPLSAAMCKATAALAVIVPVAFATPAMARIPLRTAIPAIAARAPELTLGGVAPASGATATTAITLNVSPTINIATREMDERRVARLVGDEIEKPRSRNRAGPAPPGCEHEPT